MKTIQNVFSKYDTTARKGFGFNDICSDLEKLPDDIVKSQECQYEFIGLYLTPSVHENEWKTYYGPTFTGRKPNGEIYTFPSIAAINEDMVLYWWKRCNTVVNPYLKQRYAGLVWDFLKKVSSQTYPKDLYGLYLKAMSDTINGDYPSHSIITANICERLFELGGKNQTYLSYIKNTLLSFDGRYEHEDKSPRIWGMYFKIIINNRKLFTKDEILEVLSRHENRLTRLVKCIDQDFSLFWTIKEQATLLAEYYQKVSQKDDVSRVLKQVETAFDLVSTNMSELQKNGNLDMIASLYGNFGLHDDQMRLLKNLQQQGKNAIELLQKTSFELSFPSEALQEVKSFILDGTENQQFEKFCIYFVPQKSEGREKLVRLARQFPLQYLTPTQIMDEKGRIMSVIGGLEDDLEGQLAYFIAQNLEYNSFPLRYIINTMQERGVFSLEKIMLRVKESPVISPYRYGVIEIALKAYFENNSLIFCHLIIPQIETFFRDLLEKSGEATIKPQKGKGYMLKVLDEILRQPIVENVFNSDISYYFRIVLTDQRGMNVRNNLCHGLLKPSSFNQSIADRLFHVMMLLLLVK